MTRSRYLRARTRADINALLRRFHQYVDSEAQPAGPGAQHPLTGRAYPSSYRRGGQHPQTLLLNDIGQAVAEPNANLISLRVQGALVGFFLGWPQEALWAHFPTFTLYSFIWQVLRSGGRTPLPDDFVYMIHYDVEDLARRINALLPRRPN